jgi:hypothetical protein
MQNNAERRAGIGISSSVLALCPRQHVLQERNDYYEDPEKYYQRWRGSFGHYAIEMGGPYPGVVQEVRFYRTMEVDGVSFTISGQPDWIDTTRRRLEDHKFVGWPPKELKPDHEAQVNVYKWLIEDQGYEVDSAAVNYLHTKGYIQFEVPLWTTPAVEGYIRRKLVPHARYIKTGNLSLLKIEDEQDKWKGQYCPFQLDGNPGRCCMSGE